MSDTNFIGGVVKVLEPPKQDVINNNIIVTRFRVQFPQVRNNSVVHLKFWGNLARDVSNYYQTNDYILIEGYLSLVNSQSSNLTNRTPKKIEITVLKIYPFLLNYDRLTIALSGR
jgi:single-stranded DNA-binding protein